jgi:hypothetical protein
MGWRYRGVKINWDRRFDIFRLFAGEPDAVQQEGWRVDGHGPFDTLEETVDRLAAELAAEGWELVSLLPRSFLVDEAWMNWFDEEGRPLPAWDEGSVRPFQLGAAPLPPGLRKVPIYYVLFRQPWPDPPELDEAERQVLQALAAPRISALGPHPVGDDPSRIKQAAEQLGLSPDAVRADLGGRCPSSAPSRCRRQSGRPSGGATSSASRNGRRCPVPLG